MHAIRRLPKSGRLFTYPAIQFKRTAFISKLNHLILLSIFHRMKIKSITSLLLAMVCVTMFGIRCSQAQKLIPPPILQKNWSEDYEPFRIAGNLYSVGTYDLGCYLINTPKGNILINTGLAESVPMIKAHIEALGFKFADTKILLTTQAHFDHVAGMAEIKKMTGATLMIEEDDAAVMEDGGNSDYSFGGKGSTFAPVKPDRLLHDHDTVKLGDAKVVVLHHPGHTKGSCSYLIDVKDDQRTYRVLIANMPTILDSTHPDMPTYPSVASDYAKTFEAMRKVTFDLWIASHASQFNLHNKRKPGQSYAPQVFADREGYDRELDNLYQAYRRRFEKK